MLVSTDGIRQAEVSFAAKTAIVEYEPDRIDEEGLKAAVRSAGYGVESEDEFYTIAMQGGGRWIPAYIQAIDYSKCTHCGACARTCGQGVYRVIKEDGSRRVEIANPENCLGDCHCHKACKFGALICKPRRISKK